MSRNYEPSLEPPHRSRAKRQQRERVLGLSPERHGQCLALNVLHVPYSLVSGASTRLQRFKSPLQDTSPTRISKMKHPEDPTTRQHPLRVSLRASPTSSNDPSIYNTRIKLERCTIESVVTLEECVVVLSLLSCSDTETKLS